MHEQPFRIVAYVAWDRRTQYQGEGGGGGRNKSGWSGHGWTNCLATNAGLLLRRSCVYALCHTQSRKAYGMVGSIKNLLPPVLKIQACVVYPCNRNFPSRLCEINSSDVPLVYLRRGVWCTRVHRTYLHSHVSYYATASPCMDARTTLQHTTHTMHACVLRAHNRQCMSLVAVQSFPW